MKSILCSMKTAIIIHGMPSKEEFFDVNRPASSNCHWLPWIQKKLLLQGVLAQTPEMPEPYLPIYENWKSVFERFPIDEESILIGHSCGGGFLVRWLSEHKNVKVNKVVLVAPWLDPDNFLNNGMFSFEIDGDIASRTGGLSIFYSADDMSEVLDSIKLLKEKLQGVKLMEFTNKGHFCFDDLKTDAFPELLEILQ